MTPLTCGIRTMTGCCPPKDNPSKFRLLWVPIAEDNRRAHFFMQIWIKEWEMWAPCDSTLRVISGGSRVPINQFDRGTDSIHKIIYYYDDLKFMIEVKDHRSIQIFTPQQLSNPEEIIVLHANEGQC